MRKSSGIISLMTAIFVTVLLMAIILPLAYLNTVASQGASDDELSLRAYAAAKGGVEWAYWWAQQYQGYSIGDATHCTSPPPLGGFNFGVGPAASNPLQFFNASGNASNAITCVKVLNTGFALSGQLDAAKAYQVLVPPGGGVPANTLASIEVKWIQQSDLQATTALGINGSVYSGTNLPQNPNNTYPPGIELTIVNFDTPGAAQCTSVNFCSINPGANYASVTVRNVVLLPNGTGTNDFNVATPTVPAKKIRVPCSVSYSPYECQTNLSPASTVVADNTNAALLPASKGAIVYVRAIYPDSGSQYNYAVTLRAQNGAAITPTLDSAIIDVTAKAGPVYRRIVATAQSTHSTTPAGLNYVLFSDTTICKDFSIFEAPGPSYSLNRNTVCNGSPSDLGF